MLYCCRDFKKGAIFLQLWTRLHAITYIPTFCVMIFVAIMLRRILIKKEEKVRLIPLKIIAILLIVLEIGKQITSISQGYNLYHLPFHFCSLFILFIPLAAFYSGKWRKSIFSFTTVISSTLFAFMLVCPSNAYSDECFSGFFSDFLDFHTIVFHSLVVFEFLLIVALDLYQPNTKFDAKNTLIIISAYSLVGGIMAQILKTNYNNFYYCHAEAVDNIRLAIIENIGYAAGQTVYVLGVYAVNITFVFASYAIYRLIISAVKAR